MGLYSGSFSGGVAIYSNYEPECSLASKTPGFLQKYQEADVVDVYTVTASGFFKAG